MQFRAKITQIPLLRSDYKAAARKLTCPTVRPQHAVGRSCVDSETGRVEAFSEGVFAIAITLLILEIKIPKTLGGPLGLQLLKQWPSYLPS